MAIPTSPVYTPNFTPPAQLPYGGTSQNSGSVLGNLVSSFGQNIPIVSAVTGALSAIPNLIDAFKSPAKKGKQNLAANQPMMDYQFQQQQQLNEAAWAHDKDMLEFQLDYNSPVNQVQRLEEAGLNKNLAYGSLSAGNAQNVPSYNAGSAAGGNFNAHAAKVQQSNAAMSGAMNFFNALLNLKSNAAEVNLKQAEADRIRQQTNPQTYNYIGLDGSSNTLSIAPALVDTWLKMSGAGKVETEAFQVVQDFLKFHEPLYQYTGDYLRAQKGKWLAEAMSGDLASVDKDLKQAYKKLYEFQNELNDLTKEAQKEGIILNKEILENTKWRTSPKNNMNPKTLQLIESISGSLGNIATGVNTVGSLLKPKPAPPVITPNSNWPYQGTNSTQPFIPWL